MLSKYSSSPSSTVPVAKPISSTNSPKTVLTLSQTKSKPNSSILCSQEAVLLRDKMLSAEEQQKQVSQALSVVKSLETTSNPSLPISSFRKRKFPLDVNSSIDLTSGSSTSINQTTSSKDYSATCPRTEVSPLVRDQQLMLRTALKQSPVKQTNSIKNKTKGNSGILDQNSSSKSYQSAEKLKTASCNSSAWTGRQRKPVDSEKHCSSCSIDFPDVPSFVAHIKQVHVIQLGEEPLIPMAGLRNRSGQSSSASNTIHTVMASQTNKDITVSESSSDKFQSAEIKSSDSPVSTCDSPEMLWNIICMLCNRQWASLSAYRKHVCNQMTNIERNDSAETEFPAVFECKRCFYLEEDNSKLLQHISSCHPIATSRSSEFLCPCCAELFNHKRLLREHIQTEHIPSRFVCSHCNSSFKWSSAFNRHNYECQKSNLTEQGSHELAETSPDQSKNVCVVDKETDVDLDSLSIKVEDN